MRFLATSLFDRVFKKCDLNLQENIKRSLSDLKVFFESGIKTEGLGLKHLKGNIWEIRASI